MFISTLIMFPIFHLMQAQAGGCGRGKVILIAEGYENLQIILYE